MCRLRAMTFSRAHFGEPLRRFRHWLAPDLPNTLVGECVIRGRLPPLGLPGPLASGPGTFPEAPRTTPRTPHDSPPPPKEAPRPRPTPLKTPPRGPKTPPRRPKTSQRGPQTPPGHLRGASGTLPGPLGSPRNPQTVIFSVGKFRFVKMRHKRPRSVQRPPTGPV